jgi:hypothetical protein
MLIILILVLIWASMYGSTEIEGFDKTSQVLEILLRFAIYVRDNPDIKPFVDKNKSYIDYFIKDTSELISELSQTTDTQEVSIDDISSVFYQTEQEIKKISPETLSFSIKPTPRETVLIIISRDIFYLKQLAKEVPKSIFDKFVNIKVNTFSGLILSSSDLVALIKKGDPMLSMESDSFTTIGQQYIRDLIKLAPGAIRLLPPGTSPITSPITPSPNDGVDHSADSVNYTPPNSEIPPNDGVEESPIENEVSYTPPVVSTTPPAVSTTPPVVSTTPPAVSTTPPVVSTTPSQDTTPKSEVEYRNRAGFVMKLGEGAYSDTYYCSQVLGQLKIPRSDGQCGPFGGPQCPDCKGYTIQNPSSKKTITITANSSTNVQPDGNLKYYSLYWNADGQSQDYNSNAKIVTSDCPECVDKSTGACINCGGSGGSGTLGSNGKSIVPKLKNIGSNVTGLVKDTVSGGVGLARETVTGGVGLAKETVTGGVGLARDTVTGGVGLARETVTGGVDLLKEAVSGTKSIFTSNKTGPSNPYTYNGTLSDKGTSNFIPLTADFSAFGR